jgi:hypothetical protein
MVNESFSQVAKPGITGGVGQCALCLQPNAKLQSSHLLPKALYKLVRGPVGQGRSKHVSVTPDRTTLSDRQVEDYLLCEVCEQKLSRNGESYVLRQYSRGHGKFKLRQLLTAAVPVCEQGNTRLYEVTSLLGDFVEQYLYFAASVFWRASAHTWNFLDTSIRISLGEYQEKFRLYLHGEAPFPVNARLHMHVSSDDDLTDTAIPPCSSAGDPPISHAFYIPGILFRIYIGCDLEIEAMHDYNVFALNGRGGHFIAMCPWKDDLLLRNFQKIRQHSPASKSMQQKLFSAT